ncbi:hypothetical protein D9758_004097 [Tetrapyrgos nigripes]|uniref:GATA-type domain-containing protein n=1 Tax=Tetrapyrgos nigripes TaxID=182062 RepID=A0A8H5GUB2_9AGAR|nr:hypothetical protein D9758_004097 [Tetrapyrgos nigripes]
MDSSLYYSDSSAPRTPSPHNIDDRPYIYEHEPSWQKGSLLQELYNEDVYIESQHYPMMRRATFPYVRQDDYAYTQGPYDHQLPVDPIKMEDSYVVPSQQHPYYPPLEYHHLPPPPINSYLGPHPGLPIQHTDDAASKETQYLRRRCFNCHTTEPPSWRRSTLNPGKIVCNKCGLYERTHLRPRPLRFDELRAGNKARKASKAAAAAAGGSTSPPPKSPSVKKEPREGTLARRSSVSSTSSASAGGSDWDDSASIYSNGSAPATSYNSPSLSPSFSLPSDDRQSLSPPLSSAGSSIRLPNAPLSDIASYHGSPAMHANSLPSPGPSPLGLSMSLSPDLAALPPPHSSSFLANPSPRMKSHTISGGSPYENGGFLSPSPCEGLGMRSRGASISGLSLSSSPSELGLSPSGSILEEPVSNWVETSMLKEEVVA